MKKSYIILSFLSLLSCTTVLGLTASGTIKSGKVVFEITYPDLQLDQQSMAMMPSESVLYFREDKSRVEVNMAMGSTTIIFDNKKNTGTMLMDFMGNKMALDMDPEEMNKGKNKDAKPIIEISTETKKIAGYNCKKATVTQVERGEDMKFEVWFTDEISAHNNSSLGWEEIKGFLMEYSTFQNGALMKMTARSVKEMEVKDELFMIPGDFKKVTREEMKSMFGGGR